MSSNALLEIQWYLFAAVFMLGAGYAFLKNAHVRIDFLSNRFSARTAQLDRHPRHPGFPRCRSASC
jgi:TRAP-type mannitol/chloroaromatic compound transport system permease small subunit